MDMNHMTWLSLGPGILWSEGESHIGNRPEELRELTVDSSRLCASASSQSHEPGLQRSAVACICPLVSAHDEQGMCAAYWPLSVYKLTPCIQVIDKWRTMITEKPDGLILVNKWLARSSLDMIGEGMFSRIRTL